MPYLLLNKILFYKKVFPVYRILLVFLLFFLEMLKRDFKLSTKSVFFYVLVFYFSLLLYFWPDIFEILTYKYMTYDLPYNL